MKLQARANNYNQLQIWTTTNIYEEGRLYLASSTSKANFAEGVFQNQSP